MVGLTHLLAAGILYFSPQTPLQQSSVRIACVTTDHSFDANELSGKFASKQEAITKLESNYYILSSDDAIFVSPREDNALSSLNVLKEVADYLTHSEEKGVLRISSMSGQSQQLIQDNFSTHSALRGIWPEGSEIAVYPSLRISLTHGDKTISVGLTPPLSRPKPITTSDAGDNPQARLDSFAQPLRSLSVFLSHRSSDAKVVAEVSAKAIALFHKHVQQMEADALNATSEWISQIDSPLFDGDVVAGSSLDLASARDAMIRNQIMRSLSYYGFNDSLEADKFLLNAKVSGSQKEMSFEAVASREGKQSIVIWSLSLPGK